MSELEPGIAIIHGNQMTKLRDVAAYWMREHPLQPLENEIILVQSNGMGQWLKHGLAQPSALGVVAAISLSLPSTFTWQAYRAVLGEKLPHHQPLAKDYLVWRLYRLLPRLAEKPEFNLFKPFIDSKVSARKRYQLAYQLADLFDQYQVYRADWLADWQQGKDQLTDGSGYCSALPEDVRWQSLLWREIMVDLADAPLPASRATVHRAFLTAIEHLTSRPADLPRRIMVFGVSSLPEQVLEVLAKLARFCQIILFVHNPCRYYWADIIEGKSLFAAQQRRQPDKTRLNLDNAAELPAPLLAAWGKQGCDYIRLLDQFDQRQFYQNWNWPEQSIDLFIDYHDDAKQISLLAQLKQSILDLETLPEIPETLTQIDPSIRFHIAHSRQREVEILHDQLLDYFARAEQQGQPLTPGEIVIMVPDINQYAPHIHAVFGRFNKAVDPRYLPYSLANERQQGRHPILLATEQLLSLDQSRFTVNELLNLLDNPALLKRFDLEPVALPTLRYWLEQAGIRWGLNSQQRQNSVKGLADELGLNSWHFGLQRMLLGYAVGHAEAFAGIEPLADVGGLEARWLGGLTAFVQTLEHYFQQLAEERPVSEWYLLINQLLSDFFLPQNDQEENILHRLGGTLEQWRQRCQISGLSQADCLPIAVVRDAWLPEIDADRLNRTFLTGKISFCTLMPMRAIPFRLVCLLGLNDGDYPRNPPRPGFDLMALPGHYRPGDRSRRQDDQYLFLEALLSAEENLYISWIGRSIRDNSERPPSVLVSQLRDFLAQRWTLANDCLLSALTVNHPLQPFSPSYVEGDANSPLFTYVKEWFQPKEQPPDMPQVIAPLARFTLTTLTLAGFLRTPVKSFCRESLQVQFALPSLDLDDHETFILDGLDQYHYRALLLSVLEPGRTPDQAFFDRQYQKLSGQGKLPWCGFGKVEFSGLAESVDQTVQRVNQLVRHWPEPMAAKALQVSIQTTGFNAILTGNLTGLRRGQQQQLCLLTTSAGKILDSNGQSPRYPVLTLAWVNHLFACANDLPLTSYIVGVDQTLYLEPLTQATAMQLITELITGFWHNLQYPLPLTATAGHAFVASLSKKPDQPALALTKAKEAFEGNEWQAGEGQTDLHSQRFYHDFDQLLNTQNNGDFADWAMRLYQPMQQQFKRLERS